jgi:hypothetical protein
MFYAALPPPPVRGLMHRLLGCARIQGNRNNPPDTPVRVLQPVSRAGFQARAACVHIDRPPWAVAMPAGG